MSEENDSTAMPPAGWYPDDQGAQRWWDGAEWTQRVQESPADPATPRAVKIKSENGGPKFYTRKWFVGVVAGVVGLIIGVVAAGSSSVEDDPKYKDMASQVSDTKSDLSDARGELADTKADLSTAQEAVGKVDGREKKLDSREGEITDAADAVKADAKAVRKREKAVGIVEDNIQANTVAGDGIYKVGDDIKAGTYKTTGTVGCYYAILASTDTSDIVDNNNLDGPGFLTVGDGQYLQVSRCADWVKQ